MAQTVKTPPAVQETQVRSLGQEDPLEKEMATHSSTLARKIPWQSSLAGYSPWGCKELDTTERLTHRHLPNGAKAVPGWQASFIIFLFPQYLPPFGLCFLIFFPYQTTSVLFLKFSVPLTLLTFSCSL